MKQSLYLFGVICFFAANMPVYSQEVPSAADSLRTPEILQSLVLDIEARVLEAEQVLIWNELHRRMTISGSPVSIQLVGSNVLVLLQFTPFIRRTGNILVAQVQIWILDPENNLSYNTSIQTFSMELGELLYFYPLGSSDELEAFIEIILAVKLLGEENNPEETAANINNGR